MATTSDTRYRQQQVEKGITVMQAIFTLCDTARSLSDAELEEIVAVNTACGVRLDDVAGCSLRVHHAALATQLKRQQP
jgi:hypothetical protein